MRRTGFSVFIKYRQRRLGLKRFLPSFDDAAAFAEEMRKTRFHSSEDIYIVDEASGEVVLAPPSPAPRDDASNSAADPVLESVEGELDKTTRALENLLRTRRELEAKVAELRAARANATNGTAPGAGSVPVEAASEAAEPPRSERSVSTDGLAKCTPGNGVPAARISSGQNGD
jgi:hypothetical protein